MNLMMLLEMAAQYVRSSDSAHVAMLDVSSLALPIGLFASAWAGKPFVPINYRLADAEVDALLQRIQPALLSVPSTLVGVSYSCRISMRGPGSNWPGAKK